jgi:hypothetical protein
VPSQHADGDTASDVDLLVVRPEAVGEDDPVWREQLEGLADAVRAWTGNHAGIIELSQDEFAALPVQRPPILDDLRAGGIDLAGEKLRRVLKGPAA